MGGHRRKANTLTASDQHDDRLERATRARLARLAGVPVDTSNLERRLDAALAETVGQQQLRLGRLIGRWRVVTGVAAIVVFSVLIGLVVFNEAASARIIVPSEIARVHEDFLGSMTPVIEVSDIEQVNRAIIAQWPVAPTVPQLPNGQVNACCLRRVQGCQVVCLHLDYADTAVTIVVAHDKDLRPPEESVVEQSGRRCTVHKVGRFYVVTTMEAGRSVGLVGELPPEQLVALAMGLKF